MDFQAEERARDEWLATLKEGDTAVAEWGQGYTMERIVTVLSMTKTIIRVTPVNEHCAPAEYRRNDGRMRGGEWHQRLQPFTATRKDRIEAKRLVATLDGTKWASSWHW